MISIGRSLTGRFRFDIVTRCVTLIITLYNIKTCRKSDYDMSIRRHFTNKSKAEITFCLVSNFKCYTVESGIWDRTRYGLIWIYLFVSDSIILRFYCKLNWLGFIAGWHNYIFKGESIPDTRCNRCKIRNLDKLACPHNNPLTNKIVIEVCLEFDRANIKFSTIKINLDLIGIG